MTGFTEVENRILNIYIKDTRLKTSLALIREAMENIWTREAPKLVQNFTDHGEQHSERVAGYVEKLLQLNPNMKYSEQEIFLLLAGVYLHDIGMQCDVVKYPEIKKKAEDLGANFTVEFKAKTTNGYSEKEQEEIRENHHYLSAAWIDYLYEENVPGLSELIMRVPHTLTKDLMDICKFHSKLKIDCCSESFIGEPNSRKRLIASILRFADELDINSKRVNINTVRIYSIDIKNSVYWWYHNCTEVYLIEKKVLLKVSLHPDNFKLLESLMRSRIANFKIKNKPIIDVLVEHGIPIEIDDESDVVEDSRAPLFPSNIINAIFNVDANLNESMDETSFPDTDSQQENIYIVANKSIDKENSSKIYNSHRRKVIKEYFGEGFLISEDRIEIPCNFETCQLDDGKITLTCTCSILNMNIPKYFPDLNLENTSPAELKFLMAWSIYSPNNIFQQLNNFRIFSGITSDGWNITGKIGMYKSTDSKSLRDDTFLIKFKYYAKDLTVNKDSKEKLQCVKFGVTNFKFNGNESHGNILTLDLKRVKRLTIERKDVYYDAINYLENFNGIRITCEISVEIDNNAEIKKSEGIANDLCELMSIAWGTRIQWIYYDVYNVEKQIITHKHESRYTRPYMPMGIIDEDSHTIKKFLEDSYSVYVDKQEFLKSNKYIINAYLDGKKQNDYLEQRGTKIAVVIGLFIELFLSLKPEREHIVEVNEFNILKSELEKVCKVVLEQNFEPNSRDKIYQNLSGWITGINRTSFKELLSDFCEYIDLKEDNLQSILDSRNKLISKGKFICQTYEDKSLLVQEYPNFKDPWSEYSYSLNFVDKCILKLLGYKGLYINLRNFKEEELL